MFPKVPTARAKQSIPGYLKEKNVDINYSFFANHSSVTFFYTETLC